MMILDYLLLGGFLAAVTYTIYRLFIGWRNSSYTSVENAIDANREKVSTIEIGTAATGAPWHSQKAVNRQEL